MSSKPERRFGETAPSRVRADIQYQQGVFPSLVKPRMIAYYSVAFGSLGFGCTDTLKYLRAFNTVKFSAPLSLNLKCFKTPLNKDYNIQFTQMLAWLLNLSEEDGKDRSKAHILWKQEKVSVLRQIRRNSFICTCDVLIELLKTATDNDKKWVVTATLFKNLIYLRYREEEQARDSDEKKRKRHQEHVFNYFVTATYTGEAPPLYCRDSCSTDFHAVYHSIVGEHDLLFNASIDCVSRYKYLQCYSLLQQVADRKFVFTSTIPRDYKTNPESAKEVDRISLDWWCKNFLTGIHHNVLGHCDEKGKLYQMSYISFYALHNLPGITWDRYSCVNYLQGLLSLIKNCVTSTPELSIWSFKRECGGGDIIASWVKQPTENDLVLPRDYIEKVKNRTIHPAIAE